jgi:Flp pilus assembly protein TadB
VSRHPRPGAARVPLRVVAAALLATALALLAPAPAYAAPQARLSISGVRVEPGIIRFLVTARDLAPGTTLDPASVRVRVGDTVLRTGEIGPTTTVKDVPPRGLVVVLDPGPGGSGSGASGSGTGGSGASGSGTGGSGTGGSGGAGSGAAARAAARELAADLPADVQLGLVTISGTARVALKPTQDRDGFVAAVGASGTGGPAALATGMTQARDALAAAGFQPGSDQRVLVIGSGTDATSTFPSTAVAAELAQAGVTVNVVAVAGPASGRAALRALAEGTGGSTAEASGTADAVAAAAGFAKVFSPVFGVEAFVPDTFANGAWRLDVSLDGSGLSASQLVTFAPAPAVVHPPVVSYGWVPSWAGYVAGAALFLAIASLVITAMWPPSRKRARIRQIDHFGPGRRAQQTRPEPGSAGSVIARTALAATASLIRGGMEQRIASRLDRAGMRIRPQEWVLLRVCVSVAAAVLLFAVVSWPGAVMGAAFAWLAFVLYQQVRIDRRGTLFAEQLPDALQLLIGSLRSGFSLQQGIDSLVRESPEPVAAEFGRALAEYRLGADVSEALERVAQRAHSDDLEWAVMAIRIQREVGGNLAEVLQTTVDTMRERARLRRHVRSLSAEGRLSAWVLIGLPIALSLFMFIYRRAYMAPLFTNPLGLIMVIAGGLLFLIGIFWMSRVIKVEA